jgi:hypothetical protein
MVRAKVRLFSVLPRGSRVLWQFAGREDTDRCFFAGKRNRDSRVESSFIEVRHKTSATFVLEGSRVLCLIHVSGVNLGIHKNLVDISPTWWNAQKVRWKQRRRGERCSSSSSSSNRAEQSRACRRLWEEEAVWGSRR